MKLVIMNLKIPFDILVFSIRQYVFYDYDYITIHYSSPSGLNIGQYSGITLSCLSVLIGPILF